MKIRYINKRNNSSDKSLTVGKIYDVISENGCGDMWEIISDDGMRQCFFKERFEIVKEEPMNYIFKIKDSTQEDEQIVEFSLKKEDGNIKLKANNYTILRITKDGYLMRNYCIANLLGLKVDHHGRIIEL